MLARAESSRMGTARLELRHTIRQRLLAGYAGAIGFAVAAVIVYWAFGEALAHGSFGGAPLLIVAILVAHRLGSTSIRTARNAISAPTLYVDDHRLVIDDPTTLAQAGDRRRSLDLVRAVHVGPDVAGWMVGGYATVSHSDEVQLGRYPQLPNLLIVLQQSVYVNQARRGMLRLWHLSRPPQPDRATRRLWLTVADPDAAYLVFADRGVDPAWATPEPSLPVWE